MAFHVEKQLRNYVENVVTVKDLGNRRGECKVTQQEHPLTRKIRILEDPARQTSLPAEYVLELAGMSESASVLDVGAGTGYVTIPAAKRTSGTVYALDLDQEILHYLDEKAKQAGIKNVKQVVGNFTQIPLEDELVDLAIASLSLHEVAPLQTALEEIHRVLKADGSFVCVEFEPQAGTKKSRVDSASMTEQFVQAGFTIKEKINPQATFLDEDLYIIIAQKSK